jgi:hypothetical protein
LPLQQEDPRELTVPTKLERSKVLARGRQAPPARFRAKVSACRGLQPVFGDRRHDQRGAAEDSVEDWSTESSASITERHPRKLFFQALPLGRIRGFCKPIHEQEEAFLLGFPRLKAGLDQIDEHPISAGPPGLGQSAHTPGDTVRD